MRSEGRLLSTTETNLEWETRLSKQSAWEDPWDHDFDRKIQQRVSSCLGRAEANAGKGLFDGPILQCEVSSAINAWDKSPALPPDWITRAAFTAAHDGWDKLVWKIIALTGPGVLAARPRRWRRASLNTIQRR